VAAGEHEQLAEPERERGGTRRAVAGRARGGVESGERGREVRGRFSVGDPCLRGSRREIEIVDGTLAEAALVEVRGETRGDGGGLRAVRVLETEGERAVQGLAVMRGKRVVDDAAVRRVRERVAAGRRAVMPRGFAVTAQQAADRCEGLAIVGDLRCGALER